MSTKIDKYVTEIATCLEKNFDFSVPEEDNSKSLVGFAEDWNKLRDIVKQILEDKQ